MFVPMGFFDFLVPEEQRIKNETKKIEAETRILEAKVDLKKAKTKRDWLKQQLEDVTSA